MARERTPEEVAEERIEALRGSRDTHLDLYGLGLTVVPYGIRRLHRLQALDLGQNYISAIPEWIGQLHSLVALSLGGNQLRLLPESIGDLRSLQMLYASYNDLEVLPETLIDLRLRRLELYGNPKLDLPQSILDRPPEEILRYYFEGGERLPLQELKLLLVGRGKAGKTTLLKRLAGEEVNPNELETHSIAIREIALPCPKGTVRTRAWDFGGQEILHSTHQFFLTERSLYIIVLEPRTGNAQRDAEYWLKLIETQGNASPVIVALNWSHNRRWRLDEVKLRRKFPFIVDFISTDALAGDGIQELQASIVQAVEERMNDVWLGFPNRWRQIKDAVATMRENFLTYQQYTQLCAEHGEDRPDAQADLAGILHALGLALYFGKHPNLRDTRVLNPRWVTGGVYAVIRASCVVQRDGQLSGADMPQVLAESEAQQVVRSADYPPATHGFILELMRAFQLCYASEEENGKPVRYLVPELLPEFEPEMEEHWDRAPVRLRYRYEILPPGLLPRFIVRTHALSEGAPHWRHGVVLRHAGASALIRAETDRQEIHVFVLGDGEAQGAGRQLTPSEAKRIREEALQTRGVLVAMVRRELETLHSEMKMQPIEELEVTGDGGQWIGVKALKEVEQPLASRQKLPVQPEGTAEVNVPEELDKLLPPEVRAIDRDPNSAPAAVRLFVSYAHDDERQLKRLDAMLDVLEQYHGLSPWRDKRLIAGHEWDREIRRRLDHMDIFLFIASQNSLVRQYVKDPELRRARERHRLGEIELVCVKLEPCACDDDPDLGKLQRLAPKFKSIAEAKLKSDAWEQVRKDLLPVIDQVRVKKASA